MLILIVCSAGMFFLFFLFCFLFHRKQYEKRNGCVPNSRIFEVNCATARIHTKKPKVAPGEPIIFFIETLIPLALFDEIVYSLHRTLQCSSRLSLLIAASTSDWCLFAWHSSCKHEQVNKWQTVSIAKWYVRCVDVIWPCLLSLHALFWQCWCVTLQ